MDQATPQDIENKLYFSNQLKRILKEKGIKQIELHKTLNIPKSSISAYIKGTTLPNTKNVKAIAKYLNVPVSDLDLRFTVPLTISELKNGLSSDNSEKTYKIIYSVIFEGLDNILSNQRISMDQPQKKKLLELVLQSIVINPSLLDYSYDDSGFEINTLVNRRKYAKENTAKLITDKYIVLITSDSERLSTEIENLIDTINSKNTNNDYFLSDLLHFVEEIAVTDKALLSHVLKEKIDDTRRSINDVVLKPEKKGTLRVVKLNNGAFKDENFLIETLDFKFYEEIQNELTSIIRKIDIHFGTNVTSN